MLGREAERRRDVELVERRHLAVEPRQCIRSEAVGPAETGPDVRHTETTQPRDGIVEPMILEVEPLADPEVGVKSLKHFIASFGVPSSRRSPM
jgi:hypothetical protein